MLTYPWSLPLWSEGKCLAVEERLVGGGKVGVLEEFPVAETLSADPIVVLCREPGPKGTAGGLVGVCVCRYGAGEWETGQR